MISRKRGVAPVLLTVLAAGLAATVPAAHEKSRLAEGRDLIDARTAYQETCASCHGAKGLGAHPAVPDFSAPQALVRLDGAGMQEAFAARHGADFDAQLGAARRDAILGYVRNYLMLPAPSADTDIGRQVYSQTCSVCHGDRGNAASWARSSLNPSPADFTVHGRDQLSRDEMIRTVTFGSDGSAMVAFATQLSADEIASTVDYIREAFMPETSSASHGQHDHGRKSMPAAAEAGGHGMHAATAGGTEASYPDGLTADVTWGKAFYRANCAECHGDDGAGEGPRAYFMIRRPRNFRSDESRARLGRAQLFDAVSHGVRGSTMPAWRTVLDPQQIANVSEYVFTEFVRPARPKDGGIKPSWVPQSGQSKKN